MGPLQHVILKTTVRLCDGCRGVWKDEVMRAISSSGPPTPRFWVGHALDGCRSVGASEPAQVAAEPAQVAALKLVLGTTPPPGARCHRQHTNTKCRQVDNQILSNSQCESLCHLQVHWLLQTCTGFGRSADFTPRLSEQRSVDPSDRCHVLRLRRNTLILKTAFVGKMKSQGKSTAAEMVLWITGVASIAFHLNCSNCL